jgi:hypothetical protein
MSLVEMASSVSAAVPAAVTAPPDTISSSIQTIEDANTVYAENMIAARVNSNSQATYVGKLKCMRKWLVLHHYEQFLAPHLFHAPLPDSLVLQFFCQLTAPAQEITAKRKRNAIDSDNKHDDSPNKRHKKNKSDPIKVSTLRGYKSALSWMYHNQKLKLESTLDSQIESLIRGYERTVADLKLSGDMAIQEGKEALSFTAYRMIADRLAPSSNFAWAFFLFQWNLIARSETVTALLLDHITWKQDALLVFVPN